VSADPKGTCHLVDCKDKGQHAPHPSSMSAPSQETWAASQRDRLALIPKSAVEELAQAVLDGRVHLEAHYDYVAGRLGVRRFSIVVTD
jgi:hypothetical protein